MSPCNECKEIHHTMLESKYEPLITLYGCNTCKYNNQPIGYSPCDECVRALDSSSSPSKYEPLDDTKIDCSECDVK